MANGTGGLVRTVDPPRGQVVVDCDDGRAIALEPAALEEAQPLRLGYASHVLKLQGGQAPVVLMLPGGWQTSRQSAYSMATRCVEELHVFVDTETQQSGRYRDTDPVQVLGERWTRDAGKIAASIQRYHQYQPVGTHEQSIADGGLGMAPPRPSELAVSRALEPAARDVLDDLGIDL